MRYSIARKGDRQLFRVTYTDEEKTLFAGKLENLGLVKSETERGFGYDAKLSYWRDTNSILARSFRDACQKECYSSVIDDINTGLIAEGYNIAVFRVVPAKNITEVALDKFITIAELNKYVKVLNALYTYLCNLVAENVEIDVKINGNGGEGQ